jgi:hypothetical protein
MLLTKKSTLGMYSGNYDANGDGITNVLDLELVKNYFLYGYEVTTTTQAPTTEVSYAETLIDGHGNVYPMGQGYVHADNGIVYNIGDNKYEAAQNYAEAVEAYYGISMEFHGNYAGPTCFSKYDTTGSLEELNTWRDGRSAEEIGVTEICNNWTLILNDFGFMSKCMTYLDSLNLSRSFNDYTDLVCD